MDAEIAETLYEDCCLTLAALRDNGRGTAPEYAALEESADFWRDLGAKLGSDRLRLCQAAARQTQKTNCKEETAP